MSGRKAFTLVELMVVISIIATLVMIIMPAFSRARELARQRVCATNLNAVGKTAGVYAQSNDNALPCHQEASADVFSVGFEYKSPTDPNASYGCNTRGWFGLLRSMGMSIGAFMCPSDNALDKTTYPTSVCYDFRPSANGAPLSYSFQITKRRTGFLPEWPLFSAMEDPGLAIAADFNGLCRWIELTDTVCRAGKDPDVPWGDRFAANSANHDREGQNVLRLDNSVRFMRHLLCGLEDGEGLPDNIYTKADGSEFGWSGLSKGPAASTRDSFLR
ncbi:MAG: type II secretion system protein [Planctomycetota bacterium]|jgi:prepilin-type N-terminal cleavage/methylation domain-containing protein